MKHWQLDLVGIPRNLNGKQLSLKERIELYIEFKKREARVWEIARETGTSFRLWK